MSESIDSDFQPGRQPGIDEEEEDKNQAEFTAEFTVDETIKLINKIIAEWDKPEEKRNENWAITQETDLVEILDDLEVPDDRKAEVISAVRVLIKVMHDAENYEKLRDFVNKLEFEEEDV